MASNSEKSLVLLVIIVALVGLFVISSEAVVGNAAWQRSCEETDKGMDFFERGTLEYKGSWRRKRVKTDRCHSRKPNRIIEYYCRGKKYFSRGYNCPNGCQDGACLPCQPDFDSTVSCDNEFLTNTTINACDNIPVVRTYDCKNVWTNDGRKYGACFDEGNSFAGCVACGYRGCFGTFFRLYDQCYNEDLWDFYHWVHSIPANESCDEGLQDLGVAGVDFLQEPCTAPRSAFQICDTDDQCEEGLMCRGGTCDIFHES